MQSSIIAIFSVLVSLAVAAPAPRLTSVPSMNARDSCDVAKCAIALGPAAAGCGAAVVEVGANPVADIGCLAGGLNAAVNTPTQCTACADKLGIKKAENAVTSVAGDVTSAIGGLF